LELIWLNREIDGQRRHLSRILSTIYIVWTFFWQKSSTCSLVTCSSISPEYCP